MKIRALLLLPLLACCSVRLDSPVPAAVSCAGDGDCPGTSVCLLDLGRCADSHLACIEQVGGAWRSVGDGRRCFLDQGVAGVCARGACEPSRCGDGFLDQQGGGEQCEDGNENPNDGCDRCRRTEWRASLRVGASEGGGEPTGLSLFFPGGVAVDGRENVYVADTARHRILKLDAATGRSTVVAGTGKAGFDGDGGPATRALLNSPGSVAVDGLGDLYISDGNNFCVRRVDASTGRISTVAGVPGQSGQNPEGGLAIATPIPLPGQVAVDGRGNLYLVIDWMHRVLRVDATTGRIERFAGTGEWGSDGDGGPATAARLDNPSGLAVDRSGDVYIATRLAIRRVSAADRTISSVATLAAEVNRVALAPDGRMAVSLKSHSVVLIDAAGASTPLAGSGAQGFGGDGGPATSARFDFPTGLAWTRSGALLVADTYNHRIRRVEDSVVATVAGSGSLEGGGCTRADCLETPDPWGIAFDGEGRMIVAQRGHHVVRRVDLAAKSAQLVAGTFGVNGFAGDGGPAREARLNYPEDVALDAQGNLLIVDNFNGRLRRVSAVDGSISTVPAVLDGPSGLAVDQDGSVLVAETSKRRVVRVDPETGALTVVAGTGSPGDAGDGGDPALATFRAPVDVDIDPWGRIVILDKHACRVRRIEQGVIRAVIGNGTEGYSGDGGAPLAAALDNPTALAIASDGAIYLADYANHAIRRVDAAGTRIETFAGGPSATFWGDGEPAAATAIVQPIGLAFCPDGSLFFSESDFFDETAKVVRGDRVRRVDAQTGRVATVLGAVRPAGDGALATSRLGTPGALVSVALSDGSAPLWIADGRSGRVRSVDLETGVVSTVAGFPYGQSDEGAPASLSRLLGEPLGLAADPVARVVYVSEASGHTVRSIDISESIPTVSTLLGEHGRPGYGEGLFEGPRGLLLSPDRATLFVADTGNHVVRAVDLASRATATVAGVPGVRGDGGDDGPASEALLNSPGALAMGKDGSLYVADTGNHRVRRIVGPLGADAQIETVTGNGDPGAFGEGSPASLFPLDSPQGLAVDRFGNLFVAGTTALRLVGAGDDQVATGEDTVSVIYGRAPRLGQPEASTSCLTGLTFAEGGDDPDSKLYLLDGCLGYLVELGRHRL